LCSASILFVTITENASICLGGTVAPPSVAWEECLIVVYWVWSAMARHRFVLARLDLHK